MQKITDQRIHEIVTEQRDERRRQGIQAMHRIHNAPVRAAAAVEQDNGTDVDVLALLALLAPSTGDLRFNGTRFEFEQRG